MAKIKTTEKIPDLFGPSRFEFLRTLNFHQWACVIYKLLAFEIMLDVLKSPDSTDEARVGIKVILNEELAGDLLKDTQDWVLGEDIEQDPENFIFRGVQSLSNQQTAILIEMAREIPMMDKLIAAEKAYKTSGDAPNESLTAFGRKPYFRSLFEKMRTDNQNRGHIRWRLAGVNLALPDEVLKEDFSQWLRAMRRLPDQFAEQKKISRSDLDSWCDNGFVPYSLLMLWGCANDIEITHGLAAEIIFPMRRQISESNMRRTIRPAWQKWLRDTTAIALEVEAARI